MDRNDKCVYLHKLNGVVVYVGSGGLNRVINNSARRKEHLELWDQLEKVIHTSGLSIDESKELEQQLIDKYWESGNLINSKRKVASVKTMNWIELSSIYEYDESVASCLKYKESHNKSRKSKGYAGHLSSGKHWKVSGLYVSRVIWCMYHKVNLDKELVIDHIDRDSSNNNINNLRAVTQSDNMRNRKHRKSNTDEQNIYHHKTNKNYEVSYQSLQVKTRVFFCYSLTAASKNRYDSKELAFEAALLYRDMLVDSDLIILT